jgi:hypothetical protein
MISITAPHTFHIPVMGLAYTVDSPIKVARFGIPSVISIIEDKLLEMMRKYYYGSIDEPYHPITIHEKDFRTRRITDYLNLVNKIVTAQIEKMKASAFQAGNDLIKYFELLPSEHPLRELYLQMTNTQDEVERSSIQKQLKEQIVAGAIDVNIMTKVDRNRLDENGVPIEEGSDALTALRGYAMSDLTNSSLILSAGMNPRLFTYLEKFNVFDARGWGEFDKKVVVKVSDYRSALIQGKMLAKKGIWVSEFRVESGLNCGGHAFATDGYLLGPILEEFKTKREELSSAMHTIYHEAVKAKNKPAFDQPHPIRLTVQGGIGTNEEDKFLHEEYAADSTGWGTPFLLCPEATTVDDVTLHLLEEADQNDIVLSKNSPLGIRFHYLKGTTSAKEKLNRILAGKPGSPCTEKYLATNTEFTDEPICTASHQYQALKIAQLKSMNLPGDEYERQIESVLAKECLCIGLSNSASIEYHRPFVNKLNSVTICPGPNIAYFSKIVSLQEMVDHIYGRTNLLEGVKRPHMFINELRHYITYLKERYEEAGTDEKRLQYCSKFGKNLLDGISYYRSISKNIEHTGPFLHELQEGESEVLAMTDSVVEVGMLR